jgi:hypothetical protein
MHLVGYETSASEAALTAITPIPDPTLRIASNDFFIQRGMNNIVAAAAMINSAAATLRAQIQTPSLRATLNFDIAPIVNGLIFGNLPPMARMWDAPLVLQPDEPMDAFVQNGAAVMNRVFVWLADGPVMPLNNAKVFTVRATGAASLVTATWVNTALTFGQTLPSGRYQCVGARVWGANAVAARLFPVGGAWRPGVPCNNTEAQDLWEDFRFGNTGVWFEFDNTTPPTMDVMGITDTAQVVYLDLIKIR